MAIGDVTSNEPGSGARFNDGKVRYELIPTHLLESTARVLEFGANKYAPWNWAKGMPWSVVIGCLKRHLAAIERGEDFDPETGLRHTGHIGANLIFLEHYMNEFPELDDRPKEWFSSSTGKADEQGWVNKNKEQEIERYIDPELPTGSLVGKVRYHPLEFGRVPDVRQDVQPTNPRFTAADAGCAVRPTPSRLWHGGMGAYDSSGFGGDGHTA